MESSYQSESSHVPKPSEEEEGSPTAHEKYREIISTLPRDNGWKIFDHLCLYEGFWCYPIYLENIMSAQEHFKAQPTDIILSSVPKSGTTWLKALTFAIVSRTRFDHSMSPLLTTMPHACIPCLEFKILQNTINTDPGLPLWATHIPHTSLPKSIISSGCKIVYIFRDPKDAFVSLWHFTPRLAPNDGELLPLDEAFELFCKGISFYGPYWDHVLGYWKASLEWPERVLCMKYEDLMRETPFHVKRLAEFIGYSFSLEEEREGVVQKIIKLCSFENLRNLDVNMTGMLRNQDFIDVIENNAFFRKGKVGDWQNYLTVEMASEIDRITEQKFGSYGLIN